MKFLRNVLMILGILVVVGAIYQMGSKSTTTTTTSTKTSTTQESATVEKEEKKEETLGFGSTVDSYDIDITFGDTYEFTTLSYSKEEVIKIPVHLKNNGKDGNSLNFFYFTWYAPNGTKLDLVGVVNEGSALNTSLLSNAEADAYFYVPYEEDGTYTLLITEGANTTKHKLQFNITK